MLAVIFTSKSLEEQVHIQSTSWSPRIKAWLKSKFGEFC